MGRGDGRVVCGLLLLAIYHRKRSPPESITILPFLVARNTHLPPPPPSLPLAEVVGWLQLVESSSFIIVIIPHHDGVAFMVWGTKAVMMRGSNIGSNGTSDGRRDDDGFIV